LKDVPSVGQKNAHESVFGDFEQVSNDPRLTSLGIEGVLTEAKDSFGALQAMLNRINHWTSSQWLGERKAGDAKLKEFSLKFREMLDFHHSIKQCLADTRAGKKVAQKQVRTARYKLKNVCVAGGCPKNLGDILSHCLDALKGEERFEPKQFTHAGSSKDVNLDQVTLSAPFHDTTVPRLFISTGDQHSFWHRALGVLHGVLGAKGQEKKAKGIKAMDPPFLGFVEQSINFPKHKF
jgi:hypothetical protein